MKGITDLDEGTLRRVDWLELAPATILAQAFSATFKTSFLLLGALGLALFATAVGATKVPDVGAWGDCPFSASARCVGALCAHCGGATNEATDSAAILAASASEGAEVGAEVGTGAEAGTGAKPTCGGAVCAAHSVALLAAVWFALAIARTTTARLATSGRSSTAASLKFATLRLKSLFVPALAPLLFAAAIWATGAIAKFAAGSGVLAAVAAPISALAFWAFVVLGALTAVAFPLATVAVAAEKSDGFDALARGVSYATRRPLHLIFYAVLAALLTAVGAGLVGWASETARGFFVGAFGDGGAWGEFWNLALFSLPASYCGVSAVVYTSAIYLALRRSVDGTPFDAFAADGSDRKARRLRPILQDAQGAPVFADAKKDEESAK
ncbi:MAG: hypothetical protein IJN32_00175 [Thermoguttaceae bacterium]|nr:hypothetical protein [Thermoguttaceae bacterium]